MLEVLNTGALFFAAVKVNCSPYINAEAHNISCAAGFSLLAMKTERVSLLGSDPGSPGRATARVQSVWEDGKSRFSNLVLLLKT